MKIKNLILSLMSLAVVATAKAIPPVEKKVLLEKTTSVAFAMPEYRGTYRFQVLSSGVVQKIDNKNKITKLAVLSQVLIDQVKNAVLVIPQDLVLKEEDGPRCADATMQSTAIFKAGGAKVTIKTKVDCRDGYSNNYLANHLAVWSDNLQSVLDTTIYQGEKTDAPPARIGQEGYGAPEFRDQRGFLECAEEVLIADDGFGLRLEGVVGEEKTYTMIIERSWLIGPITETHIVKDVTDPRSLGSPARYENETVKLSVQGTTTPRPDGKLVGEFVKYGPNGQVEVRKLLCSYNNK